MNQPRKMWVSAAAVGVIVVGGVSVAAAASAGRLEKVSQETKVVVTPTPSSRPAEGQEPDEVVSHEVGQDPQEAADYWTETRMEEAEPMPMPEVNGQLNDVDD
ncbi:hypothetical protein [Nonomuraea africana]|uniref:Uncharacterized protein n=1 Tax=Nonomuraea africana TaxID=46171 RepID=A0ABR9KEF4_9ACTN|nr:hypothetical protein [Nonomuraea africana]MBE1560403.1 hypothetical protein [Nonomuraea africana]